MEGLLSLSKSYFGEEFFRELPFLAVISILLRLIKYISILPWQRNKLLYFKYLRRGIIHGVKESAVRIIKWI
jgi:hypothetical protein